MARGSDAKLTRKRSGFIHEQHLDESVGLFDVTVVAGREFMTGPPLALRLVCESLEDRTSGIALGYASDVRARQFRRCIGRKTGGFLEASKAEVRLPSPDEVAFRARLQTPQVELPLARGQPPSISGVGRLLPNPLRNRFRKVVQGAMAIRRHESVHIDQTLQSAGRTFCDAGNDHSRVRVANEHDITQILALKRRRHIVNVSLQSDFRRQLACIGFKPGEQGN